LNSDALNWFQKESVVFGLLSYHFSHGCRYSRRNG